MLNRLHDELDALGELREKAEELVDVGAREVLVASLRAGEDPTKAMLRAAKYVENKLAELTTEAFDSGVDFSRKRAVDE